MGRFERAAEQEENKNGAEDGGFRDPTQNGSLNVAHTVAVVEGNTSKFHKDLSKNPFGSIADSDIINNQHVIQDIFTLKRANDLN